jgi:hypothetical protein
MSEYRDNRRPIQDGKSALDRAGGVLGGEGCPAGEAPPEFLG